MFKHHTAKHARRNTHPLTSCDNTAHNNVGRRRSSKGSPVYVPPPGRKSKRRSHTCRGHPAAHQPQDPSHTQLHAHSWAQGTRPGAGCLQHSCAAHTGLASACPDRCSPAAQLFGEPVRKPGLTYSPALTHSMTEGDTQKACHKLDHIMKQHWAMNAEQSNCASIYTVFLHAAHCSTKHAVQHNSCSAAMWPRSHCQWTKAVPCAPVCLADVFNASSSMSDLHGEHDIAPEDAGQHS